MKLTLREVHALLKIIVEVARDKRLLLTSRARVALALNMKLLSGPNEAFESVRNEKILEILPDADLGTGSPISLTGLPLAKQRELVKALNELAAETVEVELRQFDLDDLKLDENPELTAAAIAELQPLIRDLEGTRPVLRAVQ